MIRQVNGRTDRRRFSLGSILLLAVLWSPAGCDRGSSPTLVGRTAPNFQVSDEQRSIALNQFRGKTVVLNFWATWCPPCVDEIPSLQVMQQLPQLRDKVQVVAVSLDTDGDAYRKFLLDHNVTFLTVRDESQKSSLLYGATGYPETYIIDKDGVIRRKFIGPVDWTKPEIVAYLDKL